MHRAWRWWLAGLLTLLAFLIVTWVITKYFPVSWLKETDERLVLGAGAGAAVAGLVALWGSTFAAAKTASAEPGSSAVPVPSARTATVAGSNSGIASAGDRAKNIQSRARAPGEPGWASRIPDRASAGADDPDAQVRIEGDNDGIVSAGNDTNNIQGGF